MKQTRTISNMANVCLCRINLVAIRAAFAGDDDEEPWDDDFGDDGGESTGGPRLPFALLPGWAAPRGGDDVAMWRLVASP